MEFTRLLNELKASDATKSEKNIDDKIKRLSTLTTGEYLGKVTSIEDIKRILSSMKKDDKQDEWKEVVSGSMLGTKKSPKEMALEIEKLMKSLSSDEINASIPENNIDGKKLTIAQKKLYTFIDDLEERFQRISIGSFSDLVHSSSPKKNLEVDDEYINKDGDNVALGKVKINNIIPIKVKMFGEEFFGIIRPGSSGGSNGIITWQKIADSFDSKLDKYETKYDTLSPEMKKEYDLVNDNFLKAKKLPKTLPLIQRSSGGVELKVHETQEVKALKEKGIIEYKDNPEVCKKVIDIIIDVIKSSGKSFVSKDASDEEIIQKIENSSVPEWVIGSSKFWAEIGNLF